MIRCPVCNADIPSATDRFCPECAGELPQVHTPSGGEVVADEEAGAAIAPQADMAPVSQPEVDVPESPEPGEPLPAEEQPMEKCPGCGSAARPGARFCKSCGHSLVAEEVPQPAPVAAAEVEHEPADVQGQAAAALSCPACSAMNRPGAQFCIGCGQPLATDAQPAVSLPPTPPEPEEDLEPQPAEPSLPVGTEPDADAGEEEPSLAHPEPDSLERQIEAAAPAAPPEEPDASLAEPPVAEDAAAQGVGPEAESAPVAPPPPAPLPEGTIISQRYRVLEVLPPPDDGMNLYAVVDLQLCWACGQPLTDPSQPFCTECGADLTEPLPANRLRLAEVLSPVSDEAPPEGALVQDDRLYVLMPQEPEPEQMPFPKGVRLTVGQGSDAGQVRELDEDSVFVLTLTGLYESTAELTVGLYIVADGIGGHEGGEWASRLAIQAIAKDLLTSVIHPLVCEEVDLPLLKESVPEHLQRAVLAANQQIYQVRTSRDSDMGTTVTLALVLNDTAYIANVGDSRTYLWGQSLDQVTTDHSLVASLIAAGQAEPEEIYTHPQRNAIYRSLGDKPNVEVDLFTRQLVSDNVLVLCCDGLWEMIHNEGLEDLLLLGEPPQVTCDKAIDRANLAGGEDNISVVIVRVE